jgi:hypothetical protein
VAAIAASSLFLGRRYSLEGGTMTDDEKVKRIYRVLCKLDNKKQ